MNRILKIVGGPLKGAEIALVAGTKVKVGSGDDCDVLVADPSLEKFAFELEVAEDEVTVTTPDGAAKTMLDYEAKEFGASAFAIGAAEGKWPELVWPERSDEGRGKSEGESGKIEEGGGGDGETPKAEPLKRSESDADAFHPLSTVLLAAVVIALVLIAILCLRCWRTCRVERCGAVISRVTLSEVAERYGLAVIETNGQFVIRGDFKCRADRLAATAAAYQAQPGVEVDLSDDESLFEAAEALVSMVAGDSLKVAVATNRVVALRGRVGSAEALRAILGALDRDVPAAAKIDCREVICDSKPVRDEIVAVDDEQPLSMMRPDATGVPSSASSRAKGRRLAAVPRLPVCGILTVPYPCIILKNGGRVSEGGEFGGFIVEKIGTDSLTLRDGTRTFDWKP